MRRAGKKYHRIVVIMFRAGCDALGKKLWITEFAGINSQVLDSLGPVEEMKLPKERPQKLSKPWKKGESFELFRG